MEELLKEETSKRQSRIEPVEEPDIRPWRKSYAATTYHLYWMPASGPPIPFRQRRWLLKFLTRFREKISGMTGAETHLFLQMKVIYPDLMDSFLRNNTRFAPLLGLSRKRGTKLPAIPDEKYIEDLQKGKVKYDHKALQPDYSYWFLRPEVEEQTDLYFGMGGLMMLFIVPPDGEKPELPEIPEGFRNHPKVAHLFEDNRLEKMRDSLVRLQSPMFAQSKKVFGRGLEDDLQFPGLKFIVPLVNAQSFADASSAEIEEWFTVYDILLTESPDDKGLLLASRFDLDLDPILEEIVKALREEDGEDYPEVA